MIHVAMPTSFTTKLHLVSPKIPTEQSLARVRLLTANNKKGGKIVLSGSFDFFHYDFSPRRARQPKVAQREEIS